MPSAALELQGAKDTGPEDRSKGSARQLYDKIIGQQVQAREPRTLRGERGELTWQLTGRSLSVFLDSIYFLSNSSCLHVSPATPSARDLQLNCS